MSPLDSLPSALLGVVGTALLAAGLACSGGGAEPSPANGTPDAEAGPVPTGGAPVDSVTSWAEAIRDGIRPLAGQVGTDPVAARQKAVDLYITRQERIEQAVGPGTGSTEVLATTVHEAETRFHELMQLLGENPPPDSTRVAAAVTALDARLVEVLDLVTDEAR